MRRVAFLLFLLYTAFDIIASPLDVLLANIALHGVTLGTRPSAGYFFVWYGEHLVLRSAVFPAALLLSEFS